MDYIFNDRKLAYKDRILLKIKIEGNFYSFTFFTIYQTLLTVVIVVTSIRRKILLKNENEFGYQ